MRNRYFRKRCLVHCPLSLNQYTNLSQSLSLLTIIQCIECQSKHILSSQLESQRQFLEQTQISQSLLSEMRDRRAVPRLIERKIQLLCSLTCFLRMKFFHSKSYLQLLIQFVKQSILEYQPLLKLLHLELYKHFS